MREPVRDTRDMIRDMDAARVPGRWIFRPLAAGEAVPEDALGVFRETEGVSVIVPAGRDGGAGPVMVQITLRVHSSLEGVGLTAAVSGALAEAGIPANVVAAFHHDHVFVPESLADAALDSLNALAARAAQSFR